MERNGNGMNINLERIGALNLHLIHFEPHLIHRLERIDSHLFFIYNTSILVYSLDDSISVQISCSSRRKKTKVFLTPQKDIQVVVEIMM